MQILQNVVSLRQQRETQFPKDLEEAGKKVLFGHEKAMLVVIKREEKTVKKKKKEFMV